VLWRSLHAHIYFLSRFLFMHVTVNVARTQVKFVSFVRLSLMMSFDSSLTTEPRFHHILMMFQFSALQHSAVVMICRLGCLSSVICNASEL